MANHGIQTFYEYGLDIGGMDRSLYFGKPGKDLYHMVRTFIVEQQVLRLCV